MRIARPSSLRLGFSAALVSFGCDQKGTAEIQPADEKPSAPSAKTESAPSATLAATAAQPSEDKQDSAPEEKKAAPAAAKTRSDVTAAGKDKPAESDKITKGDDVGAASFSTWLQSSGVYEAGKQGAVTAVLVAKAPYKCNAKYPYKFKTAASNGITYPQTTVRGMQVSPKRSSMTIPFVPAQAGKATVSGELSFSICTDERCVIEKRNLTVTVDVK